MKRRVVLGSDHAGRPLRLHLAAYLREQAHAVEDVGCPDASSVDYPAYAVAVGHKVQAGEADLGILVCGTGLGVSMAANRLRGIRAALCCEPYVAQLARSHNDANVLCMGGRVVGPGLAEAIVDAFMAAPFSGGRHVARLAQLAALEKT
jgi:ribose 5-phosphate isomerase B